MFMCFENAAPPHTRIAVEVTPMAVSPAAALVSSTRNRVVSRGRSRCSTKSSTRAERPSVSICIVASCARSVGKLSPRLWPRCSNRAFLRCAAVAATAARQRPRATDAVPKIKLRQNHLHHGLETCAVVRELEFIRHLAIVERHRSGSVGPQP